MGGRLLEVTAYQRNQIEREIRRIVAEAAQDGRMLRIGPLASGLADSHRHSGLAATQIADQLALAAARAGVAMEISRPVVFGR